MTSSRSSSERAAGRAAGKAERRADAGPGASATGARADAARSLERWGAPGIAAALGGVVGAGLVLAWVGAPAAPERPTSLPADAATPPGIVALTAELERERDARRQLGEEVARLREEVFELTLMAGLEGDGRAPGDRPARAPADAAEGTATRDSRALETAAEEEAGDRPWFDDASLEALGLGDSEIQWLRDRWSRHELERMAMRDRAVRDGTIMSNEFRRTMREFELALVSELGADRYDLMLYATNQPNRLVVRDVIDGSPANRAGFQSGDVIVDYDGQRIFRQGGLLLSIADGEAGESVRVAVMRDGRLVQLQVPRGPLGIRLRPTTVAPSGS